MPGELNEQHIRQTAIILGLPADFVRKDYFVTKAIRLLIGLNSDYFKLVFQGGTSLVKAYKVINRLSEDIDFRVTATPSYLNLSKNAKRRELRCFRYALVEALINDDFAVTPGDVKVFYEGRYMSIRASFDGAQKLVYLKPHIAIDCFFGTLELKPTIKSISSMVKVTLGDDECNHEFFPVDCVALDETAAEKWVALSRRIVKTSNNTLDSDKHLVRHVYDLYQLHLQQCLSDNYYLVAQRVIEKEQKMFRNKLLADINIKTDCVLDHLRSNKKWKEHWHYFLEQMVYQSNKPSFEQAIAVLEALNYQ